MVIDYKEQEVLGAIRKALADLYVLMRADVKKHWRGLKREQRYAAGRGLVYLNDVAKDSGKYFARSQTEGAWVKRAQDFAKENNLDDVKYAFYIVAGPKDMVLNGVSDAVMTYSLRQDAYRLFDAIQTWEYNRTSRNASARYVAPASAAEVMKICDRLAVQSQGVVAGPVKAELRKFLTGHQR